MPKKNELDLELETARERFTSGRMTEAGWRLTQDSIQRKRIHAESDFENAVRAGKPMYNSDPYDLRRFYTAQMRDYETALAELRRGRKQSHWIWYIFPQVAGLGDSPMARQYAIRSRSEAFAYLDYGTLSGRLHECAAALLAHRDKPIGEMMGSPDDLKLRSSMTLFASVSDPGSVFHEVLDQFYGGGIDPKTLEFLKSNL